ncbi:DUF4123 domain-containing protein [Pseudomonas sp. ATCC 13867]|nr:DUF4123 domain-containing protein [Pseudomonas sp. ATCC 13867]
MQPRNSAWLDHLIEEAQVNRLSHIDLLLDATGLASPLPVTPAHQLNARLFDNTPEHALSQQGAHLRRISLDDPVQRTAAHALSDALGAGRVLALFSKWPFEPLVAHLRTAPKPIGARSSIAGCCGSTIRGCSAPVARPCCRTSQPGSTPLQSPGTGVIAPDSLSSGPDSRSARKIPLHLCQHFT